MGENRIKEKQNNKKISCTQKFPHSCWNFRQKNCKLVIYYPKNLNINSQYKLQVFRKNF